MNSSLRHANAGNTVSNTVSNLLDYLPFLRLVTVTKTQLSAGTEVFTEGAGCGKIGFLDAGVVRVYKLSQTGREITLYRLGTGESCILSMSCALSNPIHQASAVVEEDATLLTLSVADFQHLVERSHEARNYVFTQFALRLSDVMLLVEEVVFRRMDERLAELLHSLTRHTTLLHKTHEELAAELGTAREVVSRTLKEFERNGWVHLSRGTIAVVQRNQLLRRS